MKNLSASSENKNLNEALKIQEEIRQFLQKFITVLESVLDKDVLAGLKERLDFVEQKIKKLVKIIQSNVSNTLVSKAKTPSAAPSAIGESDSDRTSAGEETIPSGVHAKIYDAFKSLLPGENLKQIFEKYQELKQLPKNYYLENKLNQPKLREHIKAYMIGWLLVKNNLNIHAHTDNQLKNQILGKMHPALKTLRFDDDSEAIMENFNNIWNSLKPLRKKLHEIRDQIHENEATH